MKTLATLSSVDLIKPAYIYASIYLCIAALLIVRKTHLKEYAKQCVWYSSCRLFSSIYK